MSANIKIKESVNTNIKESAKTKIKEDPKNDQRLAAILIRGPVHVDQEVLDTLHFLRLRNKHACVVVTANPNVKGMLSRCQNYITWGEINDETLAQLKKERGKTTTTRDGKKIPKPFFALAPPRGGYERKGIKAPFNLGGTLGYRGDAINVLIKKML